jgi:hypothetical protein
MKNIFPSLFFLLCFLSTTISFAQYYNNTDVQVLPVNANSNPSSSGTEQIVLSKILDVYGQQFMDNNPELTPIFRKFLLERIEYKTEAQSPDEKYPKLSSFGLRNKNNPALSLDLSFDNHTFNPLKYNISAFEPLTQIIRFDNSDILIIVKPYNNQNKSN